MRQKARREPSKKEKQFCQHLLQTGNIREAAARTGYGSPDEALRLLEKAPVRAFLEKLFRQAQKERKKQKFWAIAGLERIAYGSVADAVRLLQRETPPTADELERMDLFCISEIKYARSGTVEVKFYDRMEALEKLAALSDADPQDRVNPLFSALEKGARQLEKAGWPGEEPQP